MQLYSLHYLRTILPVKKKKQINKTHVTHQKAIPLTNLNNKKISKLVTKPTTTVNISTLNARSLLSERQRILIVEALEVKEKYIIIITKSQLMRIQMNKVHQQYILKLFTTHDPNNQRGSGVTISIFRHLTTHIAKIFKFIGHMLGILLHVSEFFLIIGVNNPPEKVTAYNVNIPTKINKELKTLLTKAKGKI
jgi:hypothetical protein